MKVRIASAGTGKTTALVARYLHLLQDGIPLRRIAGVTFTRNAADTLRVKVGKALRLVRTDTGKTDNKHIFDKIWREKGELESILSEAERELAGATLTTIHGFMIQALRLSAPRLGLDPEFGLLGEWQANAIFEEEWLSLMYLASDAQHGLHEAWQQVKAVSFDEGLEFALLLFKQRSLAKDFSSDDPLTNQIVLLYRRALERFRVRLGASLLSPAEVERRALELLHVGLDRVKERYRIVLVDEFQDVNPLQGEFFKALETAGIQIEVVGDPKQSIYAFRNADLDVFRGVIAQGEMLEPLTTSYRHSQIVMKFLNSLTDYLGEHHLGFSSAEAATVAPARVKQLEEKRKELDEKALEEEAWKLESRRVKGRLELHWVVDDAPIADLRQAEAVILAKRIKALLEGGDYHAQDVAVLARSYTGISLIEAALHAEGIPAVLLQGRGYFERLEIRDLYHALKVGISPEGLSLGVVLRSPFAALDLPTLDAVLGDDKPLEYLREHMPDIYERIEKIQQAVRQSPLEALKFLIRAPFIGGKRYVDFLSPRQRDNVDALLFTLVESPPHDLEITLERLENLSRQTDAGDVPQQGKGVSLLTIHASKGLEWPVVAVYDMGRSEWNPSVPLRIQTRIQTRNHTQMQTQMQAHDANGHVTSATVAHRDAPLFEELKEDAKARSLQESYRLLYVAVSRAKDVLLLSGSVKFSQRNGAKPSAWIEAIWSMGHGDMSGERSYNQPTFVSQRHRYKATSLELITNTTKKALEPAPWLESRFPLAPFPPVLSPSYIKQNQEHEPFPVPDPEEGERLPGKGRTIGTLVHYAISQNWHYDNALEMDNLRSQEVMFAFSSEEKDTLMEDVVMLLKHYYQLIENGDIIAPAERSEDYAELPMAMPELFPDDVSVWQGIIDRLYCANGQWYLEDYKTDQVMTPEQYYLQMAVYLEVIQRVRGITPQVQLVYLRFTRVVPLDTTTIQQSLNDVLQASA